MKKTAQMIMAVVTALIVALPMMGAERVKVTSEGIKARMGERPALLEKFNKGEQLTPEDMAVVYYGQAYLPGKSVAESYPDVDAAYAKKDYPATLTLVDEVLRTNPVALNQLFRGYVCAASSTEPRIKARAASFENRINNICSVIYATGTGVTNDSPFIVLSKEDGAAFLRNYLQPEGIVDQTSIDKLDAYKVKWPGQNDPVIFYFGRP
ncbi:MAG: DUF4919 domain-containing protein [Candidatus Amulumruptor caecigallinarius]|nr:DUF4919 domain-containing protein [Candidatus Amulumruptor caecigallinarius]MCM1396487.1 DUF4919 domain-containing protein [Candidatus Amulumruptor caecigallinarius]MCM1453456.1 DUF4919 domain-containing protein [bacterium]